jgi:NAD(P)H-dependent flavin oxidoreductase YrpB (nitropropane dioxygenase family)
VTSALLGTALPLVAAPMAGGPSTVRLATAVAGAGAFPFLAGAYRDPAALAADVAEVRATGAPFGVNLFAPHDARVDEAELRRYARALQPLADRYGIDLSSAPLVQDDDGWQDKLDVLLTDPVPVVSVTFGLPSRTEVAALQRAGSRVLATVTTVDEARAATELGVDGLVAQGSRAGGHSGTHDAHREITDVPTDELVGAVVATTALPVVAAGGVDGPAGAASLLRAGAAAVAVGTLLLRTDESGASQLHKDALVDPAFAGTAVSRAFTGRPARGLRNALAERDDAPTGFPAVHHLTRPLRAAAAAAGDAQLVHLWAGTGHRSARTGPAAAVVEHLARAL